jgi:hypothetical protein
MPDASKEIIQEDQGEPQSLPIRHPAVTTGRDLERRQKVSGLLRPVAAPEEVLAAQTATRELVAKALESGRDYGVIPGTGNKPTLLKPGAERINAAFGVAPRYEILEREVDHDREVHWEKNTRKGRQSGTSNGLYRYVIGCELVHRESGVVIGHGIASASTMESRYVDRPRDLENTVLKMAEKRAFVAATLNAFGLSDQFTQDVEDMDRSAWGGSDEPFSLSDVVTFGKHKGESWAKVVKDAPDYVEWAIENMDRLSQEAKDALTKALEGDPLSGRREAAVQALDAALADGTITDQQHERCKLDVTSGEAADLNRVATFLRDQKKAAENGADEAATEDGSDLFGDEVPEKRAPSAQGAGQ